MSQSVTGVILYTLSCYCVQGDLIIEVEYVIEFIIKLLSENGHKLECLSIDDSGKYVMYPTIQLAT